MRTHLQVYLVLVVVCWLAVVPSYGNGDYYVHRYIIPGYPCDWGAVSNYDTVSIGLNPVVSSTATAGDYSYYPDNFLLNGSVTVRVTAGGGHSFVSSQYFGGSMNAATSPNSATVGYLSGPAGAIHSEVGASTTWSSSCLADAATTGAFTELLTVYIGATPPALADANTKPDDLKRGGNQDDCYGMARYSAHAMLASLNIEDTPLRYSPPRGPAINFTVTYNQRESQQPQTFSYSNLSSNMRATNS